MANITKQRSASIYLLSSLIPYTESNLKLALLPAAFFKDLEAISGYKQQTLRNALWKARRDGYVKNLEKIPQLTQKGLLRLQPFVAKELGANARLMVIFDIPESHKHLRQRFRITLRAWHFSQVQRSVWITKYDHREPLKLVIDEMHIGDFVKTYEALEI